MKNNSYHIFFNNLANPLKIEIIGSLKKTSKSVKELVKELNVEQSKVSHALSALKKCNIVNVIQDGKKRIYSLNKNTIVPMLKLIDRHSKMHCDCKCCTMKDCKGKKWQ